MSSLPLTQLHPESSKLIVNQISLRYPGAAQATLQDVSLSIAPHELVVALGPSGCGKTSLLNAIAGFIQPDKGNISLNGKAINAPGAERGVVFQDDALLPWLNVRDNVAFGLKLQGAGAYARRQRAEAMLNKVKLSTYAEYRIWQLSGGMRQRVGLARALAADPEVLLMDEPFGALDAFTREQMQSLLIHIWQDSGKRILLISHDIEEAVFLATELVLMSAGPGRITERLPLEFGRRHASGESVRSIKSDPRFIAVREHVLERVFEQRVAQ
jgi:taurine transport system ATP-binding protein